MENRAGASTVEQFCKRYNISRATFYRRPPKLTKIGSASRITPEHESEWLASLPVVSGEAA